MCGGVHGQTVGKGTCQGIDQRTVAADGSRQPQRWDGGAGAVEQVTHRGPVEARDVPAVDDGNGHLGSGSDAAVAADGMGDDGGGTDEVRVTGRDDGNRPGGAPVGGAEGQGTGDGDIGAADGWRDGNIAGRLGCQDDGVGGLGAFIHSEVGGGNGGTWDGIDHGHGEGQGIGIFGRLVGVRVHDRPGHGDGRHGSGGDTTQGTGAGGIEQAVGQAAAVQSVDQGAVAVGGCRQRQRRDDGTGGVGLRGDDDRAEIRPLVVGVCHRDRKGSGGDAVVAAHRVRDGGGVIGHV